MTITNPGKPAVGRLMRYAEIERRYPRLIKRMCQVAILSPNEAVSAISDVHHGLEGSGNGCEAVLHYGGAERVIKAAWRSRWTYRQLELDQTIISIERSIEGIGIEQRELEEQARVVAKQLRSARRMRAQLESELLIARRRVTRVRTRTHGTSSAPKDCDQPSRIESSPAGESSGENGDWVRPSGW